MVCCCYPCCLKARKPLPAGHDAVGPADDGWGPYKCILAVRDNGRELIPGKLCTSKNVATYPYGGNEHETRDYKVVRGTILPKGTMPAREDAVGFQTSCPGTPWYGEHYIGFTYAKSCGNNWHPGKVKDGVLYFGVGGTEW